MHATTRRPIALLRISAALGLGLLGVGACGATPDADPTDLAYTSTRMAPLRSEIDRYGDDVRPDRDEAVADFDLTGGGEGVLWIDQRDIRRVLVQYSDPDDPDAWTEPAVIHRAGGGCLRMHVETFDRTVAVGVACYGGDVFAQQAPDEGYALVSDDFTTWDAESLGESDPEPEFTDDGDRVVFHNLVYQGEVDATWTRGSGF